MRSVIVTLALLVPLLQACSSSSAEQPSGTPDEEQSSSAWRSDLETALGADTFDFDAMQQQAAADCVRTEVDDWVATLALSGARSSVDLTRIGLVHACPDAVTSYDIAAELVDSADHPLDLVCGPAADLTDADAALAEMACAGR